MKTIITLTIILSCFFTFGQSDATTGQYSSISKVKDRKFAEFYLYDVYQAPDLDDLSEEQKKEKAYYVEFVLTTNYFEIVSGYLVHDKKTNQYVFMNEEGKALFYIKIDKDSEWPVLECKSADKKFTDKLSYVSYTDRRGVPLNALGGIYEIISGEMAGKTIEFSRPDAQVNWQFSIHADNEDPQDLIAVPVSDLEFSVRPDANDKTELYTLSIDPENYQNMKITNTKTKNVSQGLFQLSLEDDMIMPTHMDTDH